MKIRFAITLISILFLTAGCQTIQNKTDEVVEKENEKYGLFVGGDAVSYTHLTLPTIYSV